jgi:hypothetical protein
MAVSLSTRTFAATRALLQGFAVVVPVLALWRHLYPWWSTPDSLEWQGPVATQQQITPADFGGKDGVEFFWDGTAWVRLPDASVTDRLLAAVPDLLLAAMVSAALVILARLLARVATARPFADPAVLELRILSLLVLAGGVLVPLLSSIVDNVLVRQALADASAAPLRATLNFAWVGAAVLIFALAQAFEQGARAAHEVEGLV